MKTEEHLKLIIGDLVVQVAALRSEVEDLRKIMADMTSNKAQKEEGS